MFFAPPIGTMEMPSASRFRPRRSASASSASWSLIPSTSTTARAKESSARIGIGEGDPQLDGLMRVCEVCGGEAKVTPACSSEAGERKSLSSGVLTHDPYAVAVEVKVEARQGSMFRNPTPCILMSHSLATARRAARLLASAGPHYVLPTSEPRCSREAAAAVYFYALEAMQKRCDHTEAIPRRALVAGCRPRMLPARDRHPRPRVGVGAG